jgi:D-tyrosyl-tRNA(Tyr) deacylase
MENEKMSTHNPGNWTKTADCGGFLREHLDEEYCEYFVAVDSPRGTVAYVTGDSKQEIKANARLVAASPELFRALRRILDIRSHNTEWTRKETARILAEWEQTARAAIAAATR